MKETRRIFKLANGNYVEEWQYSQGYFDFSETEDIFKADHIPLRFDKFFKETDGKFLVVDFNAKIV